MSQKKQSIAGRVFEILEADPYAKQGMRLGIANYSAIAALIRREHLQGASLAAIKAAIRRYASSITQYDYYKDLRDVLRRTSCALRGNVAVLTLFAGARLNTAQLSQKTGGSYSLITSHSGVTLVIDEENFNEVKKLVGIENIRSTARGLSAIILTSPPELKETPGFVAYVSELLARSGLNIVEFYSCYRDTVFVMARRDALRAYELLERNTSSVCV